MSLPARGSGQLLLAAQDLAHAGQEDEHVARGGAQGLGHGRADKIDHVALLAAAGMVHVDWKESAMRRHDRARAEGASLFRRGAQQLGHWLRRECRAHHDDAEVGPDRLTHTDQEPEHEIHLDRAFVKLIKDDRSDPVDRDIAQQPSQHDAGGLDEQPRAPANAGVEPHLIANLAPERHVTQQRDLMCHCAGRQPPGLQQDEPRRRWQVVEHSGRHEHCLARAGRSDDDDGAATRRCDHVGEDIRHGEVGGQEWLEGGHACRENVE